MNWLSLSQHAAQVVVDGLWQGLLVALLVALGLGVLPRISAAQRFAVWAAAFLIAIALPLLPSAQAPTEPTGVLHLGADWGLGLALLWAATSAVRLWRLLLQAWRVRRIWRAARPLQTAPALTALLQSCPRAPLLCVSDEVDAPSVIGFLSPRLLIPAAMLGELSEDELRQIVLHECEHLRRHDDWLNLLQKVALAVFPLNPALLWVDERLGLERELACDAGVVAATGAALDYAGCLTRLAEHRLGRARLGLALSAWARRSELARRVLTLLQPGRRVSRVATLGVSAGMTLALLGAVDGILHVPALVSFSPSRAVLAQASIPALGPAAISVADHAADPQAHETFVSAASTATPGRFERSSSSSCGNHAEIVRCAQEDGGNADGRKPKAVVRVHLVAKHVYPRGNAPPTLHRVDVPAPRRVFPAYTVPVRFSYTYAAVPFGDGWLIVQL